MATETAKLKIEIEANAKGLKKLEAELDKLKKKGKAVGDNASQGFSKMASTAIKSIGGLMLLDRALGVLKNTAVDTVQTFAEFQKYKAILTSSFGNDVIQANAALTQVKKTAITTNFSVRELTQSYKILKSRGITPTQKSIMALADISNVAGKGILQTTMGFEDLFSGQADRMAELGFLVRQNGDKMKISYRGQTKEIEKTTEALMNYIDEVGQMRGVKGMTQKISMTLSGKYNNLMDSFDNLKDLIGDSLEPTLLRLVQVANDLLNFMMEEKADAKRVENFYENSKALREMANLITDSSSKMYADMIKKYPALATGVTEGMKGKDLQAKLAENVEASIIAGGKFLNMSLVDGIGEVVDEITGLQTDVSSQILETMNILTGFRKEMTDPKAVEKVDKLILQNKFNEAYNAMAESLKQTNHDIYRQMEIDRSTFRVGIAGFGGVKQLGKDQVELAAKEKQLLDLQTKQADKDKLLSKAMGTGLEKTGKILAGLLDPYREPTKTEDKSVLSDSTKSAALKSKQNRYQINIEELVSIDNQEINNMEDVDMMKEMISAAIVSLLRDTE